MEREIVEKFVYGFLLLGLIIVTIEDIRDKSICLAVIAIELPVLLGMKCWLGGGDITLWLASLGIGAFFFFVSVVTKGQIGKGDAFVFCMTGAGIGLFNNLLLIYITFFFAFLAAGFLWLVRGVDKKYSMPLSPFVLCSYLVVTGYQIFK